MEMIAREMVIVERLHYKTYFGWYLWTFRWKVKITSTMTRTRDSNLTADKKMKTPSKESCRMDSVCLQESYLYFIEVHSLQHERSKAYKKVSDAIFEMESRGGSFGAAATKSFFNLLVGSCSVQDTTTTFYQHANHTPILYY